MGTSPVVGDTPIAVDKKSTSAQRAASIDYATIGRWQGPVRAVMKPVFRFLWRATVTGVEHIPRDGGAILCANHLSAFDSFILPSVLPRGITYVGKAEYLEDWKTRTLFPALGMIPIDRRGGSQAKAALGAAKAVLEEGKLFGIYPEGTRSRSGNLHKGHTGAARLAIETGCPIIPVGMKGTLNIQPPDQSWPRPFVPCTITIGEPIDVGRYQERSGDRAVYRQLIDEVMFEIAALSGQIYVDCYAGDATALPRRSSEEVLTPRPLSLVGAA